MQYHQTTRIIQDLITQHGVWYKTFEHASVRTSEEAAKTRVGYTIQQGAKAIIVRVKKSGGGREFVMLVLPGDKRFDTDKVKLLLGAKDVRFATPEEVAQVTAGIEPGGVPPFGNIFNVRVIVDPSLLRHDTIIFNAGDRRFSIAMKSRDWERIVKPVISPII